MAHTARFVNHITRLPVEFTSPISAVLSVIRRGNRGRGAGIERFARGTWQPSRVVSPAGIDQSAAGRLVAPWWRRPPGH